jgi:hypothetical protein
MAKCHLLAGDEEAAGPQFLQAKKEIEYILAHIGEEEMKNAFLSRKEVKDLYQLTEKVNE